MPRPVPTRSTVPSGSSQTATSGRRTVRIREPSMNGKDKFQYQPPNLSQPKSFRDAKGTGAPSAATENHKDCLNMVDELERENEGLAKGKALLEKENRQLKDDLSRIQDNQVSAQNQEDLQKLMHEMSGAVHNWLQQIWGYIDTSNNVAMASMLPDPGQQLWTSQDNELGDLGQDAGTQNLLDMGSL